MWRIVLVHFPIESFRRDKFIKVEEETEVIDVDVEVEKKS
jgi:hypothetical protein